jgi:hypothetical protein
VFALIVIAILNGSPINKNDGSLVMYFNTRQECLDAKDKIINSWQITRYRVSASCIYIKPYKNDYTN